MIRVLTILLFVLVLQSCNPYIFQLNIYEKYQQFSTLENLSRYGAVEKTADNGFIIKTDATVAIQTPMLTQSISDMTIKYKDSLFGKYKIYLRTTVQSMLSDLYVEMEVDYAQSSINIIDNESKIEKKINVNIDIEHGNRVFAINDGKYLKIYWDCDEVYNYATSIPATEYVIIRTEKNCSLEVEGWDVSYLYEDARYQGLPMYNIFFE